MSEEQQSEEDIQAWLDQVHFGSCCSDDPSDCEDDPKEKEPSDIEGSEDSNS